jgi:hypothetical protein
MFVSSLPVTGFFLKLDEESMRPLRRADKRSASEADLFMARCDGFILPAERVPFSSGQRGSSGELT